MKISKTSLTRLSFFVVVAVMAVFLIQTVIINLINPDETATALSITSITANSGPTAGGELVTITGDFGLQVSVQISTGSAHSLALDSDGSVFVWGFNGGGRLGAGTNTNSNVPVAVDTSGVLAGRDIVQISAGGHSSLALDSYGNIFAWGSNWFGELGNGVGTGSSNVPVAVDMSGVLAGRDIIQVETAGNSSLALDSDGNVFAWGIGTNGRLGNGTNTNSNVPVAVNVSGALAGRDIVQISVSNSHSLALDSDGNVFAWGGNESGQLGNGTNANSSVPVAVDMSGVLAGRDIIHVEAAGNSSLALDSDGNVFAWGSRLGNGTNTNSNVPVAVDTSGVLAGRDIVQISASGSHSLALDSEGNVFAWGSNTSGQLGNGTNTSSNVPVAVNMSGVLAGRDIIQVEAGDSHSLALDSDGNVFAWGTNGVGGMLGNGGGTNTGSNVPIFSFSLGVPNTIESITLGNLPCTNIQVINPNMITCITPAHPAGTVDVTVSTTAGSVTLHQSYTYVDVPDVPNTGHERI